MNVSRRLLGTTATVGLLGAVAVVGTMLVGSPAPAEAIGRTRLKVDVACDANTFRFSGPADEDGNPAGGANFIVEGVIYKPGTFAEFGNDRGLTPEGEPEFPDRVIGRWTCRGWFTNDGIATVTGPFVATTQLYDFDLSAPGAELLVSDGIELIDLDVPFLRAITGGTGRYRNARGNVEQVAVGANATGLFNFEFDFGRQ